MPRAPEPPRKSLSRPDVVSAAALALVTADFAAVSPADVAHEDLIRRVDLWAGAVGGRLRSLGLELGSCLVDDDDGPRAYFLAHGRAPGDGHPVLALRLTHGGVRVGLEFPRDGVDALRARMSDPARALELAAAFEALPEPFAIGVEGTALAVSATHCGTDDLRALLLRAAEQGGEQGDGGGEQGGPGKQDHGGLWLGWSVRAAVAVEQASLLGEQLADALVALGGVYVLITGEGEDMAVVRRTKRTGRRRVLSSHAPADDERDLAEHGPAPDAPRRPGRQRRNEGRTDGETDREPEAEHPTESASGLASPRPFRVDPRTLAQVGMRHRAIVTKAHLDAHIERGTRVRVLEGPFSGKVGVVHALDGKGGARVMLGLLAVRVDVKNLTAHIEGRYRPVLATSHRKPSPARS